MAKIKQSLIIDFEMNEDDELSVDYSLVPKADEIPQEGREYELHLIAMTCCNAAYETMKGMFR